MINQASLDSYRELTDIANKERAVYDAIRAKGPISRRRLSIALGWPINRVTGRVKELMEDKLIKIAGTEYDEETKRHVEILVVIR